MAEAYAWPAALPEAEMLTCLVRLHHERACEEAGGHVRYLRPAYQAPETERAILALLSFGGCCDRGHYWLFWFWKRSRNNLCGFFC